MLNQLAHGKWYQSCGSVWFSKEVISSSDIATAQAGSNVPSMVEVQGRDGELGGIILEG